MNASAATVAHFTSQLAGGAGIAAQRLHLALCRAGVKSVLHFGAGEAIDSTMIPAFQNRTFFWRNAVALANSWRGRREAKGGFVTSPRWVRKTPIQSFGALPKVINLHWVARWLDLPSFLGSLPPGAPVVWSLHDLIPITGGCHYPGECDHFTRQCGNCPQQRKPLLAFGVGKWPRASGIGSMQLGALNSLQLQCLFYSALDVFTTPSRAETFGNTALEAMACETPVIAYAAGGLTDVVADRETGLLEPEIGSVPGLARMLQWMWQHPAERRAMGIAARRRVISHFTDDMMARRYSELYGRLLSGSET